MKTFKIGFSKNRHDKIFSRLLQWYMNKNYSHVFFEFEDTILHAELSNGVNYWENERFIEQNIKTKMYEIEVTDEYYSFMREKLETHIGHKYALLQNLGVILVDTLKVLGVSIINPFRKGDNCSELVFSGLVSAFPDLESKYKKNSIRPDHIEDILVDKGYREIL